MIIIGEKINGSIPSVAKAIAEKNEEWIKNLAVAQSKAGATFIDVCASVEDSIEVETLKWLVDLVQSVTDTPIALDSPNPKSLVAAMPFCKRPGLVNSISGEGSKADIILPAISGTKWEVVALLNDDTGIPKTAEDRLRVFDKLMELAKKYDIAPARFHIDPLVEMLCTSEDGINMLVEVMAEIKRRQPTIHITGAVSNISFNLPGRKLINQAFAVLAMSAGLDSSIFDPLNKDLLGMIYATEALLGRDEYCMEYIGAFRQGLFGVPPVKK
ncbi:MAG: methyltetrahydrofolate cobalamin methyltransferase [Acidobacteriota bacterium]|jgi:5-methyltetrahydrofolate--homocysteine methyltransferase|nr:methyltetrahydrofolate cobalamin methyltransferase [Acidobacteriota bacterium]